MQRFTVSNLSGYLVMHGRTFREPKEDILFFNCPGQRPILLE